MATDVLTEPCSRDLARAILRLATGGVEGPALSADVLASLLGGWAPTAPRGECGRSSRWATTPPGSPEPLKSLPAPYGA